MDVILYGTEQSYEQAVAQQFSGNAKDIAASTGGFTVNSTVYLPIYKYTSAAPLANTLAHELTHVCLNALGISKRLPEWLNEGFAWTVGLTAEKSVNQTATAVLLYGLTKQLDQARLAGQVAPLTTRTSTGLQKNFDYNLEFEDYLAVQQLEETKGSTAMLHFLEGTVQTGLQSSFLRTFDTSLGEYQSAFFHSLTTN